LSKLIDGLIFSNENEGWNLHDCKEILRWAKPLKD
jgi:hypothetical protein